MGEDIAVIPTAADHAAAVWAYALSSGAQAGDRLAALAGTGGPAGTLLLLIGSGATAGGALVDYSGLAAATAAEHLLSEVATDTPSQAGHDAGGWPAFPLAIRRRHRDHDPAILLAILH